MRATDGRPYRYTKDLLTTNNLVLQAFFGGGGKPPPYAGKWVRSNIKPCPFRKPSHGHPGTGVPTMDQKDR